MLIRNLFRRKVRTALTLLGIAVGIASIVALVALSQGIAENYAEMTSRTSADVTIQAVQGQGQAMTFGTGIDEALIARLRTMPEVKAAWGMLYVVARVPGVPFFLVYGYEPDQAGIRRFKLESMKRAQLWRIQVASSRCETRKLWPTCRVRSCSSAHSCADLSKPTRSRPN